MTTNASAPAELSNEEFACIERLISQGGEVPRAGLGDRMKTAEALVCHREEGCPAGVAALKNPAPTYKQKVFGKAGVAEDHRSYRFELGWIYIQPQFRGRKLSQVLVKAALRKAGTEGVYATTRSNNEAMQNTLRRFGFTQLGTAYQPERGNHELVLFIRPGQRME